MEKKNRLGRGLDALLSAPGEVELNHNQIPLRDIDQNPYQPRRSFDEDELASLSDSIKAHGVLQPLVVRRVDGHFQLIAGERRLRAARAAGLDSVPVRVVDFNDQQVLEAALVENIQRADLNPIEKAQGFKEHLDRFGLTHEQLAARLGLARTTITNLVGLLDLPSEVQDAVRRQQVSTGHAKLLKGVTDREKQLHLCHEIIARGLSVHATEALIKQPIAGNGTPALVRKEEKEEIEKSAHIQSIEDELRQKLATRVEIRLKAEDKGQIVLIFSSNDDFERLLEVLRQ
jgi:ParB family transcriptional regulator, chromosome partitioning protein